jgi:hypothetical protein
MFALSRLPGDEAATQLIAVADLSRDPAVRRQAIFWLGQSSDPRTVSCCRKAKISGSKSLREHKPQAIGPMNECRPFFLFSPFKDHVKGPSLLDIALATPEPFESSNSAFSVESCDAVLRLKPARNEEKASF